MPASVGLGVASLRSWRWPRLPRRDDGPRPIRAGSRSYERRAASSLAEHGLAILSGPHACPELLNPSGAERRLKNILQRLRQLLDWAEAQGIDTARERFLYREMCHRQPRGLRYDISLPLPTDELVVEQESDGAAWLATLSAIDHAVRPVLDRLAGRTDGRGARWDRLMCGCHVALPGALDQKWHADGDAAIVCVFAPLVPLTADNGPTQFEPGTQLRGGGVRDRDGARAFVAPLLAPGELLLYDYRTSHRGLANTSTAPRALAYVVYGLDGARDTHNFPSESIGDHAALVKRYG